MILTHVRGLLSLFLPGSYCTLEQEVVSHHFSAQAILV